MCKKPRRYYQYDGSFIQGAGLTMGLWFCDLFRLSLCRGLWPGRMRLHDETHDETTGAGLTIELWF